MRADKVRVYGAADGWRWTYIASNGRTLADGGQGYSRKRDAVKAARRVVHGWGRSGVFLWDVEDGS